MSVAKSKIKKRETASAAETYNDPVSFFARHEWTIVGFLAVLAFLLGCIGYAQILSFTSEGGAYTWWDVCHASLRLFIFEGPDATGGWPVYLQIARALAPLVVLYTAAKTVWNYVRQEVALYLLLLRKRRFVVICGIGETGFRIARDYCLNSDKRVVVIDKDPLNALAASLQNYGAIVVWGNAMDPLTLQKSRAVYAKELFLCTSDDKANIAIAKNAERLTRHISENEVRRLDLIVEHGEKVISGLPVHLGLRCFLCVDDPDIYEVFSAHSFFETNTPRFAIRLFNRRETIARNVFRLCAPDMYYCPLTNMNSVMHILFVGFEALDRELILQTALTAHYTDFRLPRVTVLCPTEQRENVGRFLHRYPNIHKTLDIEFLYEDPMTITEQQWLQMQSIARFSVCYVAMSSDVEAILSARRLNKLRRNAGLAPLNFIVCLNQQNFLAEIVDDDFAVITRDKSLLPAHEPIEYFETLDETISIDIIVDEALDAMARTLHNAYLRSQLLQGGSPDSNASLAFWEALPAHKKKANRYAAAHIDVKLRISNCTVCDSDEALSEMVFPPDRKTLDELAELEHRRWMAEKYIVGYSYGNVRDEDHMWHPDLISWEELSELDREKDRDTIRQIPELLNLQGQTICKVC